MTTKKKTTHKPAPKRAAPAAKIKAVEAVPAPPPKPKKLTGDNLKYQKLLLDLRDHLLDRINFLSGDNLNRSQRESSGDLSAYGFHMADAGTDNFDREFALSLMSSEQDGLYEVEEALKRLEAGTYGICDLCEKSIAKPRLAAVPFTRLCIHCQASTENNTKRMSKATSSFSEKADEEGGEEEEEKEKEKEAS
jgi:RNA polymerase-binding transcription factor DksA